MQFGIAIATSADSWKLAARAEELGFSHAWFYDTQMLSADCFVAMGAAAVNTRRIRLGTGVLVPSNRIAPVAAPGNGEMAEAEGAKPAAGGPADDGAERRKKLPEFQSKNRRAIDRAFVRSIFSRDHPGTADEATIEAFASAILALVGSNNYAEHAWNGVTARLRPGSALKPFVYGAAFEAGDTPATIAEDVVLREDAHQAYTKDVRSHGFARYRESLAGSYNLSAVHTLQRVGVGTVLYNLGVVVEAVTEGHLLEYLERRRMDKRIDAMSDHVVICGFGRVGHDDVEVLEAEVGERQRHRRRPTTATRRLGADRHDHSGDAQRDTQPGPTHHESAGHRLTEPVLSPNFSTRASSVFSIATSRFDMCVSFGNTRWRPPFTLPDAPPASTIGSGLKLCWLPSLSELPYRTSE